MTPDQEKDQLWKIAEWMESKPTEPPLPSIYTHMTTYVRSPEKWWWWDDGDWFPCKNNKNPQREIGAAMEVFKKIKNMGYIIKLQGQNIMDQIVSTCAIQTLSYTIVDSTADTEEQAMCNAAEKLIDWMNENKP